MNRRLPTRGTTYELDLRIGHGTYVSTTPAETDSDDLSTSNQLHPYQRKGTHVLASDLTSWTNFSMIGLETGISFY